MSLYKKSQEMLYADFIEHAFAEEDIVLKKKLQKLGFTKAIEHVEKSEAYEKYLLPCLADPKITTHRKTGDKFKAIEWKLRRLEQHISIKAFYLYSVNVYTRKIKLLYGRDSHNKFRKQKYDKQLIISDSLLKTLNQKKLTHAKLEPGFKKLFASLEDLALDGCFFHVIKQAAVPQAIVIVKLGAGIDSYQHIQTPLALLLDLAFATDMKLKPQSVPPKIYHLIKNGLSDSLTHLKDLSLPYVLKDLMQYILHSLEEAEYNDTLPTFLDIFRIHGLLIFEKTQPQDIDNEPIEPSSAPAAPSDLGPTPSERTRSDLTTLTSYDATFNMTFCHGLDESLLVPNQAIPELLLTADHKSELHDAIFQNIDFLADKATLLLTGSETRKMLIVMDEVDFGHFYEMVAPTATSALTFFEAFLEEMINFYYTKKDLVS